MLSEQQVKDLVAMAGEDGHCAACGRKISIYTYKANKQLATILKAMRSAVENTGKNDVDFNRLSLPYSLGTQRTKMRLHGLIAKVRDDEGEHKASRWLITKKGGDWLRGVPIPLKVIVFDNQVIGHGDEFCTIKEVLGDPEYEERGISTGEAEIMHDLRQPQHGQTVEAQYLGLSDEYYTKGRIYTIQIDKLVVGAPVRLLYPVERTYGDIARFMADWKIIKKEVQNG